MSARSRLRSLLALALLLLVAPSASAQAPEQVEAFVYGVNAAIPDAVVGTFAPPTVETIYLLAEETSILSPRRTLIYFWPITNEFRASWTEMNEQVEGTLEILRGNRVLESHELTTYTIHFTSGEGIARPELYLGDAAVAAHERFESEREAAQNAIRAYQQARQLWLAAAREAQQSGTTPPPAPEPPEPYNRFSTGLNRGFPVALEPGRYRLRTRLPDGTLVPASERDLVVFEPRRVAMGYEVIPESRWTAPQPLSELGDVILGEPGSVLFLQPRVIREMPALEFERLQNPQFPGEIGEAWRWVTGEPVDGGTLEIVVGDRVVERLPSQEFYVKQVPGASLGYEILPYEAGSLEGPLRPEFEAYRIELDPALPAFAVRLVGPGGEIPVGSRREVRVAPSPDLRRLLAIPLIPLVAGGLLLLSRHRRLASD